MNALKSTGNRRFLPLLIFCAISILGFAGCKQHTRITGTVRTKWGSPVYPATITLSQGEHTQKVQASQQGKFDIALDHPLFETGLKLTVTSEFYKTTEKSFSSRDHLQAVDLIMEERPEPTLAEIRKSRLKGIRVDDAKELAELMCHQLPNAAAFPLKSFLSGDDVHDTLVLLSRVAQQCLVNHLADSTWMPDSRSEPMADFHAGDAALWILTDAGLDFDSVIVPLMDKKKWNGTGVYEYFYWVNQGDHRKLVQKAVKRWLEQHPECCGNKADYSETDSPSIHKVATKRFAELKQVWTKLKPGMDETLARQLLGRSDGESNIKHMEGVMDYRSHEKSAAFYFIETTANVSKLNFRERDSLRDRYVIVFFSGDGKFIRAFSNVPELPPIYPTSEKRWEAMIEASMTKMDKGH